MGKNKMCLGQIIIVLAEADDMAEMHEFRQSREDEAIKKLQELPQDDQYLQLNTNDGEEKTTQRSGKNRNNNRIRMETKES